MSGTVKTVLLVGGVAVGVVVVMRMLSPAPKVPAQPKSGTQLISTQSLISGISALGGLFGGGNSGGRDVTAAQINADPSLANINPFTATDPNYDFVASHTDANGGFLVG